MNARPFSRSIAAALLMILTLLFALPAFAATSDYAIEQVYINMPAVTAFYRGGDGNVSASLGGEKLTMSDEGAARFGDTGMGAEYYILVDISGSIPDDRFADVKNSVIRFIQEKRPQDKVILYSFGDTVTQILNGSEDAAAAEGLINAMVNDNQNTALYDAIDTATDAIVTAGDTSESRRLIVVISDGKDCADNTRSNNSAEKTLNNAGVALYTVAVENDEGDSPEEITQYQGQFSSISRDTGGIPWTAQNSEQSVYEGLTAIQTSVLDGYRATFSAKTNRVSNKREDFSLDYGDNHVETRTVRVARNTPDTEAPAASVIFDDEDREQDNRITVEYSEQMLNADKASSYSVSTGDESVPVAQVIELEPGESYQLVFSDKMKSGDYTLKISNTVTDASNEENPLKSARLTFTRDIPEENAFLKFAKERWYVLAAAAAALAVLIVFLAKKGKKKEEEQQAEVVNNVDVGGSGKRVQNHVVMKQVPTKNVTIWISNGRDQPRQVRQVISGSLIVGRAKSCDLYCDDPMMSKQHFALELDKGDIFIQDLNSRNGTSVNGIRIPGRQKIGRHDEITAGNLKFVIEW